MARFNFRLQPLLGVKEQIEDQKELEYGQALKRLDEERKKKFRMLAERENLIDGFRKSLAEPINPPDLIQYNNYLERIKARIKEQTRRIEAAEAHAEKKRLELVRAIQERKMLSSIRERRLDEFKQEEKLAEQKQVDELVSYKYNA